MTEPEQVEVRAIDIIPDEAAIWCTIADGEPFANTIEHRHWSEDGETIWFMLGSHNFYKAKPDELVKVVLRKPPPPHPKGYPEQYDNDLFLANRPKPKPPKCPHCAGTGFAPPDPDWYFVEGVRYCVRCRTRRCVRQVGGTLPCPLTTEEQHALDTEREYRSTEAK